ncbi:hypothetical protein CBM2599_U20007 [Cupriavidus taiwanensis]|uniref:hypothetical protein n=1 Tax=Cupriavidus taiwanensis TaxID=164546 RepID=UPI000E182E15|nr:hypothetical protein [Cupriavidus taiwanensis]SOZ07276.1 hypothetical protein CBM2599_U20007 [Cupriavidus taiwanensis]
MSLQISMCQDGPFYSFEASYCYSAGERYNSGRGLSVSSSDLAHLNSIFDRFLSRDQVEPYALLIRRMDTGEVVRSHRDMKEAHRSMMAAVRIRREARGA